MGGHPNLLESYINTILHRGVFKVYYNITVLKGKWRAITSSSVLKKKKKSHHHIFFMFLVPIYSFAPFVANLEQCRQYVF